jgi:Peptidase family M1 domain
LKKTFALALLGCSLASISVAAEGPSNIVALAAAYANPTLGPAAKVEKVPIVISNISIELTSGTVAQVRAGGETIGLFFIGNGTYVYHSTDSLETSLIGFEAKRVGRSAQGSSVKGSFERLYLRAAGIALPKIPEGIRDEALEQAFKAHVKHWSGSLLTPSSHLLLRQKIDAPSSPVAVAEIAGRDEDEYILDSIDGRDEGLYAMLTRPSGSDVDPVLRDALFPVQIAGQPVGRARGAFVQPLFLLTALDYALTAGDHDAARLSVTESIVPRGAPQSAFRFNLLSGVFDERSNYRKLQVDEVTDASGNQLPYHFEHGSILVGLPAKMPVGAPFTVRFEISGNILYRLGNGNAWQLGTEAWFPQPELNGQFYTVHSVVKVKKPWLPFTPGDTVARTEQGDFNVIESTIGKPVQFAVAHAGKYTMSEQKYDDVTIRVATYNGSNAAAAKELSDLAYQIIKFYEPWLGPFPFKEYNIIEINDLGWGQAPPGTMFMTKEAFSPMLGEENREYSKGVNQRFAHEIAHQYWGIIVKMGTFEEQWLTEAFAEYCAGQIVKQMKGDAGYRDLISTWRADAKDAGSFAPIPLANRITIPWSSSEIYRTGLIYDKGALLLEALHGKIGDEKFRNVMRTIQGRFAWRFLTTNDVEEVFAHFDPKTDYHSFFQRYYWGTEMPEIR